MRRILALATAVLGVGLCAPAFAAAGIGVQAEGGLQAYTGQLSDSLRVGPSWGVAADIAPKSPVGLELRYQGASNQLFGTGNIFNGPRDARVIQNGGEALIKASIVKRPDSALVEPYLGGGIGLTRYHVTETVPGFQDDTVGEVPFSAGINVRPKLGQAAKLTVGVRADYNFLFSNQFSPTNEKTDYGIFEKQGGDTYRGLLTLGGAF